MAAKRTWKVKVKDQDTFERVQTLVRALGLPEEQIVSEALQTYWDAKEPQVKQYVSNLFGDTALFDQTRGPGEQQPQDVQQETQENNAEKHAVVG